VEDAALAAALAAAPPGTASVSCGLFHTAFLAGGRVFVCGRGTGGRLGMGDEANAHAPVAVTSLPDDVEAISLGGLHSLFRTRSGELFACGFGGFGALGLGDYKPQLTPQRLPPAWGGAAAGGAAGGVSFMSAGGAHSLAVSAADGALWAWGRDEGDGRLGISTAAHADGGSSSPLHVPLAVRGAPAPAPGAAPLAAAAATAGGFHTLVLLTDAGGVLSFGGNANGELGREGGTWAPGRVAALDGAHITQLAAGGFHSAALTADGEVRCARMRFSRA
jgi:alpha-tubulin suppressor-like RCC1 family protein